MVASSAQRPPLQRSLFCGCGRPLQSRLVHCATCAWEIPYSARYFGGQRSAVLLRDGRRCQTCGSSHVLHVHHREPGKHELDSLITLCAACHARVHRLQSLRYWLPPVILPFWEEQHPETPRQLQFEWEALTR